MPYIASMNETLQTICWTLIGVVALYQIAHLYYRVHVLEMTIKEFVDVMEKVVKKYEIK